MAKRIAARPVSYGGIQFRSTLEARWAVFFDLAGIAWRYEPKWFDLPNGKYLPDFWLPAVTAWVEVKPSYSENAMIKLVELFATAKSGAALLLTSDDLRIPDGKRDDDDCIADGPRLYTGWFRKGRPEIERSWLFASCPSCGSVRLEDHGLVSSCRMCGLNLEDEEEISPSFDSPLLRGAFQKAQRYHFGGAR